MRLDAYVDISDAYRKYCMTGIRQIVLKDISASVNLKQDGTVLFNDTQARFHPDTNLFINWPANFYTFAQVETLFPDYISNCC